jgi:hypothetical protein
MVTDDFLALIVASRLGIIVPAISGFCGRAGDTRCTAGDGGSKHRPSGKSSLFLRVRSTFARYVEETVMSLISIRMPEDLEEVLRPVLERDPDKGTEWLRAGFEARLAELYQQWQTLRISTARFAELLGVSLWELADLLRARGLKTTNLPG